MLHLNGANPEEDAHASDKERRREVNREGVEEQLMLGYGLELGLWLDV